MQPDLTMMGKIIGGGLPVGAIGGSESLMSCLDPRDRGALWHSGTFNGNPLTCAAGAVSIRELTPERIDTMDRLGERLARELKKAAMAVELPFSVRRVGSLMNVFFLNDATAANHRARRREAYRASSTSRCSITACSLRRAGLMALSTVLSDELVNEVIQRASQALQDAGFDSS